MLTLLWVEPGKGGLQVERDGEWVDAPPVPGAFVVNIGELLEYATQGYLKATNHRVVSPRYPDDRISVPFFFNPALDSGLPLIELPAELAAEATRRHAGSRQPDPRAVRRERAQVAPARPPRRRRDPPRRPRRGAGRGIRRDPPPARPAPRRAESTPLTETGLADLLGQHADLGRMPSAHAG